MANCPKCQTELSQTGETCPGCGSDASWWLTREGETYGPYDLATVRFILSDERATADDLAMIGRDGEWQPLGELITPEDASAPAPTSPTASRPTVRDKPEPKYRNWSVVGWLVYVMAFMVICIGAATAIIWPAHARATRERATAEARTNLEQIGLALLELYPHEHSGCLPQKGKWEEAVALYVPDPEVYRPRVGTKERGYWYNDQLAGGNPQEWANRSTLEVAAEPGAFEEPQPDSPRDEGFLYLYADGEVRAHPPGQDRGELEPRMRNSSHKQ